MRIDVRNEVIRSNLELIKALVKRARQNPEKLEEFEVYVEKSTGGLMLSLKKFQPEGRWKAVRIRWIPATESQQEVFEVYEVEGENQAAFVYGDLSKEARDALADTIHTINQFFRKELREKGVEKAVKSLSETDFFSPGSDLFINTFYHIEREQAENLLNARSVGTFLFRKDPYAEILEEELRQHFQEPIYCYTLTFVDKESRVADYTIVDRLGKYQIYNDDPSLLNQTYSSMEELMNSLKNQCHTPLRR